VGRKNGWVPITIAALAFASLGLPDGALGVAWPSIRRELGLPLGELGSLLVVMTVGHLLSSFGSGPAAARLGAGRLLLWSNLAFAASALGFALAPGGWALLLASLVWGTAAGMIDAGLNAYAAARFSPRVITWLHACFGGGAMLGPVVVGGMLQAGGSWRGGYAVVAGALGAMTVGLALTRGQLDEAADAAAVAALLPPPPRLAETLRRRVAWTGAALFCLYTGLEATPGRWAYSLLTEARGMAPDRAAYAVAAYWASFSLGRVLSGFAAHRVAPRVLLRAALAGAPAGAILVWTGSGGPGGVVGLMILGLCFAPVFPLLIALTPDRVGPGHASHAIGLQVSAAALGAGALPGAIGLVARRAGLEVVGPFLFGTAVAVLLLYGAVESRARITPPPSA